MLRSGGQDKASQRPDIVHCYMLTLHTILNCGQNNIFSLKKRGLDGIACLLVFCFVLFCSVLFGNTETWPLTETKHLIMYNFQNPGYVFHQMLIDKDLSLCTHYIFHLVWETLWPKIWTWDTTVNTTGVETPGSMTEKNMCTSLQQQIPIFRTIFFSVSKTHFDKISKK